MFSFRKLWRRLISLFLKPAPRVLITRPTRRDPATKQDIPLITRPTRRDPEPALTEEELDRGRNLYRHLGHALESLDECFDQLDTLKRFDPYTYELCSRIGAIMVSYRDVFLGGELRKDAPPEEWPGLLMIFCPTAFDKPDSDTEEGSVYPRFVCYVKITRKRLAAWRFVPRGQVFYEVLEFFSDKDDPERRGLPLRYCIGLDTEDGTVYALKRITSEPQYIRSRGYHHQVHHKAVTYPWLLNDAFNNWKRRNPEASKTIDDFVSRGFRFALGEIEDTETGIQVNVQKGELQTRFGVPYRYTSYFFKDREFQATVNGARRRIFHYVKAHERVLADDSSHQVEAHFRGVRRFEWKGYQINLTVPDVHHPALTGFAGAAEDAEQVPPGKRMVSPEELGDRLHDAQWKGTGEGPRV